MSWGKIFLAMVSTITAAAASIWLGFSGLLPGTEPASLKISFDRNATGGPFELISQTGEMFDNKRLAGKPYLVFFGFTQCPDVCPTTLTELTELLAQLGPAADRVTPLFITIDPERDSPEILAQYMTAFDNRFVALRGDKGQTDAVVQAFSAYYRKVPIDGGGYTMDHTAGVFLMTAKGKLASILDREEPRETKLTKLRRLVDAQ